MALEKKKKKKKKKRNAAAENIYENQLAASESVMSYGEKRHQQYP
jgi:hypothetical protein